MPYLQSGAIEQVICGGENYDGARPCHYEWVKQLHDECLTYRTAFSFIETGTHFVKDGRSYFIRSKQRQAEQAYRSGLSFGHLLSFNLKTPLGFPCNRRTAISLYTTAPLQAMRKPAHLQWLQPLREMP